MEWFLDAGLDRQRAVECFEGNLETFREICAVVNPGNDPVVNEKLKRERRRVKYQQCRQEIIAREGIIAYRQERIANLRNML